MKPKPDQVRINVLLEIRKDLHLAAKSAAAAQGAYLYEWIEDAITREKQIKSWDNNETSSFPCYFLSARIV